MIRKYNEIILNLLSLNLFFLIYNYYNNIVDHDENEITNDVLIDEISSAFKEHNSKSIEGLAYYIMSHDSTVDFLKPILIKGDEYSKFKNKVRDIFNKKEKSEYLNKKKSELFIKIGTVIGAINMNTIFFGGIMPSILKKINLNISYSSSFLYGTITSVMILGILFILSRLVEKHFHEKEDFFINSVIWATPSGFLINSIGHIIEKATVREYIAIENEELQISFK